MYVGALLPAWLLNSDRKLCQFLKYATNVYGLPRIIRSFNTDFRVAKIV